jgi:hypothetical protein
VIALHLLVILFSGQINPKGGVEMKNEYEVCGDTAVIFLRRKNGDLIETVIDLEDLEKAKSFKGSWYAHWHSPTQRFYVCGHSYNKVGKRTTMQLHQWLCGEPIGMDIDHKNHDTLDNRRSVNLRIATRAENKQNLKGALVNSKSGILGVFWNKKSKKWRAFGKANGGRSYLGEYKDVNDAVAAREKWESENIFIMKCA